MLRELYILSKIEKKRQAYLFGRNPNQILKLIRNNHDGFPDILGFQLAKDRGEILMTDAGLNLGVWFAMLED